MVVALSDAEVVDAARRIAAAAHAGQVDKLGAPYNTHPARVAASLRSASASAQAVAWLHDVIEDTAVTAEDLAAAGFSSPVVDAVVAITRVPHEAGEAYYRRVAGNALALEVKYADISDNLLPDRVAQLDPATRDRLAGKYAKARLLLAEYSADAGTGR